MTGPMLEGQGASFYHLECLISFFAENLHSVPRTVSATYDIVYR